MPEKKSNYDPELGKHYGKPDLERLGIFAEMGYIEGRQTAPRLGPEPIKGLNLICPGRKYKNGTQHGYFDDEFRRLYIGEAIVRKKFDKKAAGSDKEAFKSGFNSKLHSTPGDYYGTFSGNIEAFSRALRKGKPYVSDGLNFVSTRGKMGGPGYADICLNKYPEHYPEKYKPKEKKWDDKGKPPFIGTHFPSPYFDKNPYPETDYRGFKATIAPLYIQKEKEAKFVNEREVFKPGGPGKWQGGAHDGCFDKFPEHMPDRYVTGLDKPRFSSSKDGVFFPQSHGDKTKFTESVVNADVMRRLNSTNYKTYEPRYVKYLLD